MLSEKSKNVIDLLSEQELKFEVELGAQSRFQREKFAYLKVRLAELENERGKANRAKGADTMKIFLSWSGHSSYQVAEALHEWLRAVLPFTRPWLSAEDINKGARWANEIANELNESNFGIICIVPGNVEQPWLNFEAGAISKALEIGHVAPLLIYVDRNDVTGPLGQFQSTVFERADVFRLIESINAAHEIPIERDQVRRTFDACWTQLEAAIGEIEFDDLDDDEDEDEIEEDAEFEEIEENILIYLSQNEGNTIPVTDIARQIDASVPRTTHHLRSLLEDEYVYDALITDQESEYGLDDNGRAYLIENNLIE